jgi:hypothetical protein
MYLVDTLRAKRPATSGWCSGSYTDAMSKLPIALRLAAVICAIFGVMLTPPRARAADGILPGLPAGDPHENSQLRIENTDFRLVVPFRTQKDGGRWQTSNCGPATLGMLLDGFGIPDQATDDLRIRAHTY